VTLHLHARLFGSFEETAGMGELDIELEEGARVRTLWESISVRCPGLAALSAERLIAVNEQYAGEDDTLRDGDVVAFFPPVSGG